MALAPETTLSLGTVSDNTGHGSEMRLEAAGA